MVSTYGQGYRSFLDCKHCLDSRVIGVRGRTLRELDLAYRDRKRRGGLDTLMVDDSRNLYVPNAYRSEYGAGGDCGMNRRTFCGAFCGAFARLTCDMACDRMANCFANCRKCRYWTNNPCFPYCKDNGPSSCCTDCTGSMLPCGLKRKDNRPDWRNKLATADCDYGCCCKSCCDIPECPPYLGQRSGARYMSWSHPTRVPFPRPHVFNNQIKTFPYKLC